MMEPAGGLQGNCHVYSPLHIVQVVEPFGSFYHKTNECAHLPHYEIQMTIDDFQLFVWAMHIYVHQKLGHPWLIQCLPSHP